MAQSKADMLSQLQADIRRLEGFKPAKNLSQGHALGVLHQAFPGGIFPLGAVHEFFPSQNDDLAATSGFIAGLMSCMLDSLGAIIWVSSGSMIFPPALANYGLQPDRVIFVDVGKEKDILPALHVALKCSAVSAVVGEARTLDFTSSRRLQLAVEESQATGFIIRNQAKKQNTTACISRWLISSLPSEAEEGLPGIGFPKWQLEILRMRNGKTGIWHVQWKDRKFASIQEVSPVKHIITDIERKVG